MPAEPFPRIPQAYRVNDVQEAVELAERLKTDGAYDWFRGQSQEWLPHSSLLRLLLLGDAEKVQRTKQRFRLFAEWIDKVPDLHYLRYPEHVHDPFVILQHYGVPTHYLDFTTSPAMAGFFAADTENPPSEGSACIYCLNTAELEQQWDWLKDLEVRKEYRLQTVRIDVRNLWRLQAQKGVFLYCDYNWDVDFPMDRILFPHTGYPPYPSRDLVYPPDKSPLEQLLDQYFSLESATFVNEEIKQLIEKTRRSGGNAAYMLPVVHPGGFDEEAFLDPAKLVPLDSWQSEVTEAWSSYPEEEFRETVGRSVRLGLGSGADAEAIRRTLRFGVKQALSSERDLRHKAVNWSLEGLPDGLPEDELCAALALVWNGMRRLPYEDDEISDALGTTGALVVLGLRRGYDREPRLALFAHCCGDAMKVGFTYEDGSASSGFAAIRSIENALRTDLRDLVAPKYRKPAERLDQLFQLVYNPRLMFEFGAFKSLFAREVIPAQAALDRTPVLFNPTRLIIFGLP